MSVARYTGDTIVVLKEPVTTRPVIIGARAEPRSEVIDRRQCAWHVRYQFCGLSAEITVHAESEVEARAKAADRLRRRGLKLASTV